MNIHKTFRRRPRRLLKVLCTFNLRPVSIRLSLVNVSLRAAKSGIIQSNFQIFIRNQTGFVLISFVRNSSSQVFLEIGIPINLAKFIGKNLYWSHFLINLRDKSLQLYLKKYSDKGTSLWVFGNFQKYLFYRIITGNCFSFVQTHNYLYLYFL